MKKKKNNVIIVIAFLIMLPFAIKGQFSPAVDKNWALNSSLSDEFTGSQIDTSKWSILDDYVKRTGWTRGWFRPYNASIENGILRLKAENSVYSAGIQSKNAQYLYGYYEMRAKLPGYLNPLTNLPCSQGFFPAFWTYHQLRDPNNFNCVWQHNEIDIVEPNGLDETSWGGNYENDAQTNDVGYWMLVDTCIIDKFGKKVIHNLPPLYENYHKFAAECAQDRVIFYFDDVAFDTVIGQSLYPTHLMRVVMDSQLQHSADFNSNTPWPVYYDIDYFRFYQLNTSFCGTDASINTNTELINFQYGIRRNITIGNGSSTISLNVGDKITFRTTNGITINGAFTVPAGCELNLIPTTCP